MDLIATTTGEETEYNEDHDVVVCLGRENQFLSIDVCSDLEPRTIEQVRLMYRKFKEFKEETYVVYDEDDNAMKNYVRICGRAIQFNDSCFNHLPEIPDPHGETFLMVNAFFDAIQCCVMSVYKQRMLNTPISQWKPIVDDALIDPLIFTRIGYDNGSEDTSPEVCQIYLTFIHQDKRFTPRSIYERVTIELRKYYLLLMKQCKLNYQEEQEVPLVNPPPKKRGRKPKVQTEEETSSVKVPPKKRGRKRKM